MALNFPNTPLDGETWVDPSNGAQYIYSSATQSWSVTGINAGLGTVTSVSVVGTNGITSAGNPVIDLGTITVSLDINGPQALPILP